MPWIVCGLLSSGWSRASDCPVIPVFSLGQGLTSVLLTCGVRSPFAVRLSWMFSTVPCLNASDTSPSAKQNVLFGTEWCQTKMFSGVAKYVLGYKTLLTCQPLVYRDFWLHTNQYLS